MKASNHTEVTLMDTKKGHPRRGICLYSYHNLLGKTMTLEDAFLEMYDTGATCFEFLTSYIPNYPNPSPEWVDKYWRLCEKYGLQIGRASCRERVCLYV